MFKKVLNKDFLGPGVLGAIYYISRAIYNEAGIQFDADTITRTWHFIDNHLLRNDLWRSIFYLHTQPPLMNLLTGLGLQIFPESYATIFHVFFLLGGFLLTLTIYILGNRLGFPKCVSVILATFFTVSPATIVYENYYFYTYPTTILLALSALFLARFLEKKRTVDAVLFSFTLAANALTWSLFHLVWLLGCFGIIVFLLKENRRKALWLVAPAFLLVFAWYAKNGILYDSFSASSWAGLNLFKTVTNQIPGKVRKQWIKEGVVSELALVPPFRSPDVYLEYFPETPITGVPLLDDINVSTGYRNQHHLSYIYAGERYLKDSVRMLIYAPRYYLNTIPYSLYVFLHSASDYNHTYDIRIPIDEWDTTWNRLFYGQWQKDESVAERVSTFSPDHVAWWLAVGILIVITATPVYLWRRRTHYQNLEYGLILFMFWNVFFVSAAGILMELGENNRFRFVIDPFMLMLAVFFIIKAIERVKHKFKEPGI